MIVLRWSLNRRSVEKVSSKCLWFGTNCIRCPSKVPGVPPKNYHVCFAHSSLNFKYNLKKWHYFIVQSLDIYWYQTLLPKLFCITHEPISTLDITLRQIVWLRGETGYSPIIAGECWVKVLDGVYRGQCSSKSLPSL